MIILYMCGFVDLLFFFLLDAQNILKSLIELQWLPEVHKIKQFHLLRWVVFWGVEWVVSSVIIVYLQREKPAELP